ncbi:sulfite exporter TauE/SafE family protein [bacterium]|nr:sulfite exporter TauE/SafE family protein [bacterium]
MTGEFIALSSTAAVIGFVHTIMGPDHYLPFVVLAKARQWNGIKTALITLVCGIGHVLSSIVLGLIGIALGTAVFKLESVESFRGDIAAWLFIAFGVTYLVWGIHRAVRNRPHKHVHLHKEGDVHEHVHTHSGEHFHIHNQDSKKITPWILFVIFIFGPCEPLIPLVMYPAAQGSMISVVLVASIFGLVTVLTMLGVVLTLYYGTMKIKMQGLERYSHALAGLTIFLCGAAIKFLGL